eukprot:UN24964
MFYFFSKLVKRSGTLIRGILICHHSHNELPLIQHKFSGEQNTLHQRNLYIHDTRNSLRGSNVIVFQNQESEFWGR